MSESTHIRDLLTPEEFAEHQKLAQRLQLLDLARSNSPLSTRQLAKLLDLSPSAIAAIEASAKHKILQSLLNQATN